MATATRFRRGEKVEVASEEEGFVGSYYTAEILSRGGGSHRWVQYDTLLTDDEKGFLRELVPADEIRPPPPPTRIRAAAGFSLNDAVDAFDNDGWWMGRVTARKGLNEYLVYFPTTGDELWYPISRLRVHLEWLEDCDWVAPRFEV